MIYIHSVEQLPQFQSTSIISYRYNKNERKKKRNKEKIFLVMRTLRSHSLNNFPMYHMVLLIIVVMLYITALVLIYLKTENLYLFFFYNLPPIPLPHPLPLVPHVWLFFWVVFFRLHMQDHIVFVFLSLTYFT